VRNIQSVAWGLSLFQWGPNFDFSPFFPSLTLYQLFFEISDTAQRPPADRSVSLKKNNHSIAINFLPRALLLSRKGSQGSCDFRQLANRICELSEIVVNARYLHMNRKIKMELTEVS
jgi:hypothetical protein